MITCIRICQVTHYTIHICNMFVEYSLRTIYRPLGYGRLYLPLCKVADTSFHIQGDELCEIYVATIGILIYVICVRDAFKRCVCETCTWNVPVKRIRDTCTQNVYVKLDTCTWYVYVIRVRDTCTWYVYVIRVRETRRWNVYVYVYVYVYAIRLSQVNIMVQCCIE